MAGASGADFARFSQNYFLGWFSFSPELLFIDFRARLGLLGLLSFFAFLFILRIFILFSDNLWKNKYSFKERNENDDIANQNLCLLLSFLRFWPTLQFAVNPPRPCRFSLVSGLFSLHHKTF